MDFFASVGQGVEEFMTTAGADVQAFVQENVLAHVPGVPQPGDEFLDFDDDARAWFTSERREHASFDHAVELDEERLLRLLKTKPDWRKFKERICGDWDDASFYARYVSLEAARAAQVAVDDVDDDDDVDVDVDALASEHDAEMTRLHKALADALSENALLKAKLAAPSSWEHLEAAGTPTLDAALFKAVDEQRRGLIEEDGLDEDALPKTAILVSILGHCANVSALIEDEDAVRDKLRAALALLE